MFGKFLFAMDVSFHGYIIAYCKLRAEGDSRITLNSRLATAAAAIVNRIIRRRRPLVFRPVSPFRNGSRTAATMMIQQMKLMGCHQTARVQRTDRIQPTRYKLSFGGRTPILALQIYAAASSGRVAISSFSTIHLQSYLSSFNLVTPMKTRVLRLHRVV